MTQKITLKHYAAAGCPAVAIETADEDRIIASVIATLGTDRPIYRIASTGGLVDAITGIALDEKASYPLAFSRVTKARSVLIVLDLQHIIKNAAAYRTLRDILPRVKAAGSMLIMLAPNWTLPAEIEHDVPVMRDNLPTRTELAQSLKVCEISTGVTVADPAPVLDAMTGLTMGEAENSVAMAYAVTGKFDTSIITAEKMKLVRQNGLVDVISPADITELGGLGEFRKCVNEEILPSIHDTEVSVAGVLLNGVLGNGKSLAIRILGGLLGYPILAVNFGRLKGSLQGQSEANTLSVFRLARAIAPCIMMFDELEKGVGGHASSAQTDGGVGLGMLGIFLTQAQEIRDNGEKVFLAATTNDYEKLPSELTRRFELQFFVGLPSLIERKEIAAKKLAKFAPKCTGLAPDIAELAEDWTGAEIEDLVRSAARRSQRQITKQVLVDSAKDIKPIARRRAEEISRLQQWGRDNLRMANTVDDTPQAKPKRKISSTPTIDKLVADTFSGGQA